MTTVLITGADRICPQALRDQHFRHDGDGAGGDPADAGASLGGIVNVTSGVALAPMPLTAAYTASKPAITGFTGVLAQEPVAFGLRAKATSPRRSGGRRQMAWTGCSTRPVRMRWRWPAAGR